jgi:hypothetical protein
MVLIPENGLLGVGLWTGAGYTDITLISANAITFTQKISGGLSGGFSGTNIPDPAPNTQNSLAPPGNTSVVTPLVNSVPAPDDPQVSEPVDAITGSRDGRW